MTATRVARTPAAQRAVLTEALTLSGWTAKRTPARQYPHLPKVVELVPPPGSMQLKLLLVSYPHSDGQLAELIAEPTRLAAKGGRGMRPSWRLSAFDAPATAVLAAAKAAAEEANVPTLDVAGWEISNAYSVAGQLTATCFTDPQSGVDATFHFPMSAGDCGGWLINGTRCYADASAHVPGAVIHALATGLNSSASL